MRSLLDRTAKHFLAIKAARQLREEVEKAGLDNLKILADKGISIIETYLNGCSPEEKATYKQDGNTLLKLGVTPDMVLEELVGQNEELATIMEEGGKDYKQSEISKLKAFLEEEEAKK
ncbi:hypothetical protein ES705_26278 [subsurface metagenome]|jgi:hypothetical protein